MPIFWLSFYQKLHKKLETFCQNIVIIYMISQPDDANHEQLLRIVELLQLCLAQIMQEFSKHNLSSARVPVYCQCC